MKQRRVSWGAAVLCSLAMGLVACGSDADVGGADSPQALIEAHIEASRSYDLAADCALFTPERRSQMASFDGDEVEGYCERATQEVVDRADDAARARTAAIYTDPTIEPLTDGGDQQQFEIIATDGSYREIVEVVQVDGRWWIGDVQSDVDADHDHDHADEAGNEDDG